MIEFKSNMMRAAVLAAVLAVDPAGAQERPGNFLDNLFGGQQRQQQPPSEDGELAVRINQLELQIRQLTGTIEQLQFRNQQLEQQLRAQGGNGVPPQANMQPQANMPPQTSMPPQGNIPRQAALPPPPGRPPQAAPLPPPVAAAPAPGPGRRGDAFDPSMNPSAPGAPRSLGGGAAPDRNPLPFRTNRPRLSWPIRRSACPVAAIAASRSIFRRCRAGCPATRRSRACCRRLRRETRTPLVRLRRCCRRPISRRTTTTSPTAMCCARITPTPRTRFRLF